jgi:predicted permease
VILREARDPVDPALAVILTSLLAGFIAARLRVFPDSTADAFNRFVVYVCLPAVVLRLVPKLAFDANLAVLVITPWVLLGVAAVLVTVVARACGFRREVLAVLLLCVPLGNTSFLGFPLVGALLGQDAVRFAVVYDQVGSFLILATYGLVVVARFSGDREPSARTILRRVATFPPFIALVVALLPLPHSDLADSVLKRIGDTLVPIAMFAVGLKLELRRPKDGAALAFGLGTKMLLFPLIGAGIARSFAAPESVTRVSVLESGMPPMITAGALAIAAGLAPELAAALVAYGVLLSLVTLPGIARLLFH